MKVEEILAAKIAELIAEAKLTAIAPPPDTNLGITVGWGIRSLDTKSAESIPDDCAEQSEQPCL